MINDTYDDKDNFTILIVDNSPANLHILDETLRAEGYSVHQANTEKAVLRITEQLKLDLVLLPTLMPEVSGYELCQKLKTRSGLEHVPVIFTSADKTSFDIAKAYRVGGVDFIHSPFSRDELLARVRTQLSFRASTLKLETQVQTLTDEMRSLATIVEKGSMRVVITDLDGNIEYVNPAFTLVTGYSSDEAIGQNPKVIQSGKTPVEVYQDMWRTIKDGKVWTGELLNKRKDESLYWESATIAPVMDQDGMISRFVAVKENITQQKEAELALQKSEHKFQTLVENANEGILVIQDKKHVYCNPRWLEMIGYSLEAYRHLPSGAIIHPDDASTGWQAYHRATSQEGGHETAQFRIITQAGGIRWINANVSQVEWEGHPAGLFLLDDVTDLKQAQVVLQDTLDQLALSIKTANLGVWVLDVQTGHLDWNDQLLEIYGLSRTDFENNMGNWRSLVQVHPEDKAYTDKRLAEVGEGQSVFDFRFRFIRPDGVIRHVEASASPVLDEDASIVKITGIIQDITDLIETEETSPLSSRASR